MSLLAAGCAVSPVTPVITPTLPPARIVQVTYTPSPSPQPTVTLAPTTTPSPSPLPPTEAPVALAQVVQPPAPVAQAARAASPADDVAAGEQYTIDLINARRAEAGAAPLWRDETLMSIARARVADMVARGYTGHDDPVTGAHLGREWMRAAGFASPFLGENWYGSISPPPGIVDIAMAWFMTDPPHANNILSPNYAYVGVGIAYNGRQWLLVQNFAGQ